MRIVGYVRESADPQHFRPAFAQQEMLRRFAAEHTHLLVAICQDLRQPGRTTSRDGYLSLLGVVAAGAVDAVVFPGLSTLSTDETVQEVALWDLKRRGVAVLSTEPEDQALLADERTSDPERDAIRRVLGEFAEPDLPLSSPLEAAVAPDGDVLVHIIAADDAERREYEEREADREE